MTRHHAWENPFCKASSSPATVTVGRTFNLSLAAKAMGEHSRAACAIPPTSRNGNERVACMLPAISFLKRNKMETQTKWKVRN